MRVVSPRMASLITLVLCIPPLIYYVMHTMNTTRLRGVAMDNVTAEADENINALKTGAFKVEPTEVIKDDEGNETYTKTYPQLSNRVLYLLSENEMKEFKISKANLQKMKDVLKSVEAYNSYLVSKAYAADYGTYPGYESENFGGQPLTKEGMIAVLESLKALMAQAKEHNNDLNF